MIGVGGVPRAATRGGTHNAIRISATSLSDGTPSTAWPALAHGVDPPVGYSQQVEHRVGGVCLGQHRLGGHAPLLDRLVGGRGDPQAVLGQHATDRADLEPVSISIDVVHDHGGLPSPRRERARRTHNLVGYGQITDLALEFSVRSASIEVAAGRVPSLISVRLTRSEALPDARPTAGRCTGCPGPEWTDPVGALSW